MATVMPSRQDSMEEIQLPPEPENIVTFYNNNTEMAAPLLDEVPQWDSHSPCGANDVQTFEDVDCFELPKPPKVVNIAKPSDDQAAFLWFDYKTNLPKIPVLSWEIKRYKLNKDGRWTFKSSRVFHEKDTDKKKKSRMFRIDGLNFDIQYRFTVSATNVCGAGNESKSSNILFIEAPLPNGWFRTKQPASMQQGVSVSGSAASSPSGSPHLMASSKHRISTSEAANPITNMSSYNFIYYNLHTGQASLTRPDTDPYFLENLDVVQLFDAREMKKLKEIFDEEILHFDKVTKDRMGYILLEVGEKVHPNKVKYVIGELCATEHYLSTFPEFMDVMYTFKKQSLTKGSIVAAAGNVFSCITKSVISYGHIGTVGLWTIYLSKLLDRKQFIHKRTKVKTCNMPQEVRLSLSENDEVYRCAVDKFNPFEVDIIKLTFLHLDCHNCGEVNVVEMYRYFLVACADHATLKNKILTPAMLNQRKKLYSLVTSTGSNRLLSFKVFINILLALKAKDNGFMSLYKGLVSAMEGISEFKPTKSFLLQTLDKYLTFKKQKIYERGKELLEKIPTDEEKEANDKREEEEKRKHNPFAAQNKKGAIYAETHQENGLEEKHPKCCFCGCRERDPDMPPM